jgi:DNA repair protein RadD
MVGRGFRLHFGKANCLVLDYGGNVLRHGPVDQLQVDEKHSVGDGPAPAKECPNCRALIAPAYSICPQCGHAFPPPERKKHESQATNAGVLSGQVSDAEFEVRDITFSVHTKKDADDDAPKTLRVDYRLGLDYWVSEWICFEHSGWARRKAEQWWKARSPDPCPDTAQQACDLANNGALAHTESVTVRSVAGEKFDRIHSCKLGPKPVPIPIWTDFDPDEVPF